IRPLPPTPLRAAGLPAGLPAALAALAALAACADPEPLPIGPGVTAPPAGETPPTGGATPPTGNTAPPVGGATPPAGGATPPAGCLDRDLDGYQDAACNANAAGTPPGGDCDDTNNLVKPGRTENCANMIDNNCDGKLPAQDPQCAMLCADMDNDGFQSAMCNGDRGTGADCDDVDPRVNPRAMELCGNMRDDDCAGGDLPCLPNCTDLDLDGFGVGSGCRGLDCDDRNQNINPWRSEICGDGIDQNCAGGDLPCRIANCTDNDRDGFGFGDGCLGPDCNDSDPNTNPGAVEVMGDGIDQDCNNRDLIALVNCDDRDGDGYGVGAGCLGVDCDDADPRIHPGRAELCGNGLDDDCARGDLVCTTQQQGTCVDMDRDGHGQGACLRSSVDCNDNDPNVNPFAEERCNGVDDNCNGTIDECAGRNQVCDASGYCAGRAGSPCARDNECSQERGLVCDLNSRQCRVGPNNNCMSSEDCVSTAECVEVSACGVGRKCYQREAAPCANDCNCTGTLMCNQLNSVCVACADSAACRPFEVCTAGGFCASDVSVGGPGVDARLRFFDLLVDCFSTYRGSPIAHACAQVDMAYELQDSDFNVLNSIPNAEGLQDFVCEDPLVANHFPAAAEFSLLEDLFGCGAFDVFNIFWEQPISPSDRVCIYYTPSKGGFSFPLTQRSEVVVVGECNLSVVE
ncbi:MAG: hypothetical protein FJ138_12175, partial [Deltaproteobacteria bacterium]|nr:hypothetical protein [Deltaproteobacteria bacterium]